jgi:hypothetical protein
MEMDKAGGRVANPTIPHLAHHALQRKGATNGADIHYDWSHKYFDNNFKVLKVINLSLQKRDTFFIEEIQTIVTTPPLDTASFRRAKGPTVCDLRHLLRLLRKVYITS